MDAQNTNNSTSDDSLTAKPKHEFLLPEKQIAIKEALDRLFVTEKYKEVGVCKACCGITSNKCQQCNDFYCKCNCEHPDWAKHEGKCVKLSTLVHSTPLKNSKDENILLCNNGSPFATLAHQVKQTSGKVNNGIKSSSGKILSRKSEPLVSKSLPQRKKREEDRWYSQKRLSLSDSETKPKELFSSSNDIQNSTRGLSSGKGPVTNNISVTCKSNGVTTEAKLKTVIWLYKEPNTAIHWVMNKEDFKDFELIQETLAKDCDNYECVQPELGLVCGSKYSDEWYRARITALKPTLRVHYIDYGNVSDASPHFLKKLPNDIKMIKDLVFRIEFVEGTAKEFEKKDLFGTTLTIEIKQISTSGVYVVDVIKENSQIIQLDSALNTVPIPQPVKSVPKKASPPLSSSMNYISAGSKGVISFLPGDKEERFGTIIPEGDDLVIEFNLQQASSLHVTELRPISAEEGDYVLVVDYHENRRRGKVVSILCSTYYVLLIDYGIVIMADDVYLLPGKKTNLIHLGVKMTINKILSPEKMRELEKSLYQVTGKQESGGAWLCELKDTSNDKVIAVGYIEAPPEEGVTVPMTIPVESDMMCELSIITGANSCYIRPLSEEVAGTCLEMSSKMMEFLAKVEPLAEPPEIGKMYAAKNKKDDCFHRVLIKSMEKGQFVVKFVDYGTIEMVEMKDLKPLPVNIKVIPYFALEVKLRGITAERLSESATKYLNKLIEHNVELVLDCEEMEDEVILREKESGIVVNEVIENSASNEKDDTENDELSSNNSYKELEDEDIIMKSELKFSKIPLYSKYELALQYIKESEFFTSLTFWMANADEECFGQIGTTTNLSIAKYCQEVREPYRPKVHELCLALFEGDWYRALTLNVNDDKFEVFFVDFGNTCVVMPRSIRKMKREFLEFPALAFKCTISGMGKLIGKPDLKRRVYEELRRRMSSVFSEVLVTKKEFDIYHVTIPEIESILGG